MLLLRKECRVSHVKYRVSHVEEGYGVSLYVVVRA